MLLSKLVFLSVKNVNYLDDPSFNYDGFLQEDFDNDIDYSKNINNVFTPLNEAFARLSDLERIPYIVEEVSVGTDKTIDLSQCKHQVRRVMNIAQVGSDGSFVKLGHTMFGKDKVRITSPFSSMNKIYIEYKQDIPVFSRTDFENEVDLYDAYGIDNLMCNFIMEYVQGKLNEALAPELANMHITRAESYFSNIPTVQSSFPQANVEKVYRIGD